jgi:hypothetical protein
VPARHAQADVGASTSAVDEIPLDRSVPAHDALAARPGVTFNANEGIVIVLRPGFYTLDAIGLRTG